GGETRLGTALKAAIDRANDALLAGVIVISDGVQTSGLDALSAAEQLETRGIPIYTAGVGSTDPRRNVRIQQVNAPARVYPEDRVTITGVLQAEGFAGRSVQVQLFAREAGANGGVCTEIGTETITFADEKES